MKNQLQNVEGINKQNYNNKVLQIVILVTKIIIIIVSIKYLHTHAAHYLSGCYDNIVGRWVMEEVEKRITEQQNLNINKEKFEYTP